MHGTKETDIRYHSDGHNQLTAQYDASFVPDPKDGQSTGGWIIKIFGAAIAWLSKKLAYVALKAVPPDPTPPRPRRRNTTVALS